MRKVRHALFVSGILLAIFGWLPENLTPDSWMGYLFARRYAPAMVGYRILSQRSVLSSRDQGFGELLELASIGAFQTFKSPVNTLRLAGLGFQPSGNSIYVELLNRDGGKVDAVTILNPEVAIKERFLDRNIRATKAIVFFLGISISVLTYIIKEVSERRKERLRAFQ